MSSAVFLLSLGLVSATDYSPYLKVDDYGYITSTRWKDRMLNDGADIAQVRASKDAVTVKVPDFGTVVGGTHKGAEFFLGMPYAKPPLGELRFMPAQPIGTLSGTLNATQFCPSAIGSTSKRQIRQITIPDDAKLRVHEDSLCVNIWRPKGVDADTKPIPVMVFIYGGGFVGGSSTNAWYDGKNIAAFQNRIMVSFNYRTGPLGFFSHESLVSDTSGTGGANGLLDQNAALKWINTHAAAFGGGEVSIFGESAGALSVCSHVVSPTSAGLFQHAVIESGPCTGPWGAGEKEEGLTISKLFMTQLGCSDMACMRNISSSDLADWPWSYEGNQSLMSKWKLTPYDWQFPGYWVDDYFLPTNQYELFESATINAKAVMIVGNSMDGYFSFLYPDTYSPTTCTGSNIYNYSMSQQYHWQHFSPQFPGVAAGVEELYPCTEGKQPGTPVNSSFWQFALADRDYNIHCASDLLAQTLQKRGVPVYRGTFSVGPRLYDEVCLWSDIPCCQKDGQPCYGWASHGAEIPFVFNTTHNACESESLCGEFVDPFSGDEPALVRSMQEYWTSFLATGTPTDASGAAPVWPQAGSGLANLNTPAVTIDPNPLTDRCKFWSKYHPSQRPRSEIVV